MSSKLRKLIDTLNEGINPEWEGLVLIPQKPSEDGPFHVVDKTTYDYLMKQVLEVKAE